MNWSKGFTAQYYAYILDPITWREIEKLQITGGNISRGVSGLRDSASINVVAYPQGTERWVRVYMDAEQDGASAHVPLFTGLATSPERDFDGKYETNQLECYSVLKPAQDILLDRGWYAPAEINGSLIIQDLLRVTPARVYVNGNAPSLMSSIIAEEGESNLSMVDKILAAINWRMRLQGDGTIELCPHPLEPTAQFDPLDNDVIEPTISIERDWYNCPNVFRAIYNDLTAIVKDEDINSPLSIVGRGREVWAEETNAELNTGEGIAEYAQRRLKELQKVSITANYSRRFDPDVLVGDLISLHYPEQALEGLFVITDQDIEIGFGARTEESVEKNESI